ncbi:protein lplB, partial [Cellulomonas bogoriensis 69B4 = DSM 16987]
MSGVVEPVATPGGGSPQGPSPAVPEAAVATDPGKRRSRPAKKTWREALRRDWRLYTFVALPMIWFLIFRYLPMAGNAIAFRRFRPGGSIFGDEFVGVRYFEMFINDPAFWNAFQNTLILGALSLAIAFPMPIILALLLNELRSRKFKRIVQTISYLPHF